MNRKTVYEIRLRVEPDCREDEALRGLRWILKRALRQYGLRCIWVRQCLDNDRTDRDDDGS